MSEDEFVHAVTEGQSAAPMYFLYAATRNRQAHDTLDESQPVTMLDLDEVLALQADGAYVIDGRDPAVFAAGHLRGSINVGLEGRYAEYVGEVVPAGSRIVVIAEDGHEQEALVRLARIGFDEVVGALARPLLTLAERPDVVEQSSRLTAAQLAAARQLPDLQLVDIRADGEVALGMLEGARQIPLPTLVRRAGELDPEAPTVVYCAGGYRSSIAASTLRALGFADVSDVIGGYEACRPAPTEGGAR